MGWIDLNKKSWQLAALVFLSIVWGSSFILVKRGLEVYEHDVVVAIRLSIAFVVIIPFVVKHIRTIKFPYWKWLIVVAIVGNGIPFFFFTKGQTELSSSLSGMLNTLVPFYTLIIGATFFGLKAGRRQVLGVVIGMIGALGLISSNGLDFSDNKLIYTIYPIVGTLCYAISINITRYKLAEIGSMVILISTLLILGPLAILYLLTTDFVVVTKTDPNAISALIYTMILALFGTIVAVIVFYALIKKTSALFASSVTYLMPVVAIGWGVFEDEPITLVQILSIVVILVGVATLNKAPKTMESK